MRSVALLLGLSTSTAFLTLNLAGCGADTTPASTTSSSSSSSGGGGSSLDPFDFAVAPGSCAYDCAGAPCSEETAPYECPSAGDWKAIPHVATCAPFTGTYPTPVTGQCTASPPTGDALKYAGLDPTDAEVLVMPGGRRMTPVGAELEFTDPRSMTSNVVAVPGTTLVLTVDTGYGDHIVRAVDVTKIDQGPKLAITGQVNFQNPESLNQGIAFSPPDRVYVATSSGHVQGLKLDVVTGALTRDNALSVNLPVDAQNGDQVYVSGVAVSQDGTRLFASGVRDKRLFVADIAVGSPTYGAVLGQVTLAQPESYGIYTDPSDLTTSRVYVPQWADHVVNEVDVTNPKAPKVARTFQVEKDPEGVTFLDGRWMVVGNDLGDSLSLIDRVSGTVTSIKVDQGEGLPGLEPSSLTYDAVAKRLYVAQAGVNAIGAYDVDLSKDPPTIAPAGRLPTQWWPSGVVAMPDGAVVVSSLMGRGTGASVDGDYNLLHGGLQRVPAPTSADLVAGDAAVLANNRIGARKGYPTITCPPGVDDFPIPSTNTGKRSPVIDHVFIVVRENKSYDALLGDLATGKGNPLGTLMPAAKMDGIWTNFRKLAKTFATSDNFYTPAFISTQGHLWTTHGRTVDFNEREWPVTGYGRGLRTDADSGGVNELGRPGEGSLFDWLGNNNVPYDILGEIVGLPRNSPAGTNPIDSHYPGGPVQSIAYPDIEKACYVAGRVRVVCDINPVVYMTLPNDHTTGVSPDRPSPETMFASNDEATGILIDAISHSPIWQSSLVIVTEDDPAQGSESVDYHRTVVMMASPWVKRGYMSHTHIDVSSLHKLLAHVLALPYPNREVADAALPLDAFSSTPDYTPYEYAKRTHPLHCGKEATAAEKRLTDSWDMAEVDEQQGLEAQVDRWLKGKQYQELPARIENEVQTRLEARKRGERVRDEDDR
jgi:hypothetical protein